MRLPTLSQNAKSEKRGAKHEKSDAKHPAIQFSFFAFRDHLCIFRDKCIASFRIHRMQAKLDSLALVQQRTPDLLAALSEWNEARLVDVLQSLLVWKG